MRITTEIPDHAECAHALLGGFVACAEILIAAGVVPPFPTDVPHVVYRLEPPGEEDWKLPHLVVRDGWGDCEDLAIWLCAGLHVTGEDPGARCVIVVTGRNKLHCLVLRSDGTHEDPSVDMMTPADRKRLTDGG